jgi:hypothetical protein
VIINAITLEQEIETQPSQRTWGRTSCDNE